MSEATREELLELYKDLRVADVRDGMDWVGMHGYGTVDKKFRPLFRTRVVGIARTARYVPFEGPMTRKTGDEYTMWSNWYYGNVCTYPWGDDIEEGDFICIDVAGVDVGLMGSENVLKYKKMGARAYLLNGGGIRDTDEVILQGIPVWSEFVSQGMDQGRLRFCEKDTPIAIGGVAIYPGDVVVADNDGVIVVPKKMALDVAKYAHQENANDRVNRRKNYEALGWELDNTVK